MLLKRNWMGFRAEEFWFDAPGYLESKASLATLRSFAPVSHFDCRIPESTWVVSLAGSESDWMAKFSQRTRASIHKGERDCILSQATEPSARKEFFQAYRAFAAATGLSQPRTEEYSLLEIFLARNSAGSLLHGCACLYFPEEKLYRYRYSVAVEKSQANAALLFQAMRRAKALGCERFDLGGRVPNPKPGSKEERINFFKSQFGGEPVAGYFHLRGSHPLIKLGLKVLQPVLTYRAGYRWLERLSAAQARHKK